MDKHILIKMPDGSVWLVSHREMAEIIAEKQITYEMPQKEGVTKESLVQELLDEQYAEAVGSDQFLEWLEWSDIAPRAIQVKLPDPPYDEWWKKQVDHWSSFAFVDEEQEKRLSDLGWNITHAPDGTLQISREKQNVEIAPLYCARFVRDNRPCRVVFRLGNQEEAQGYIKENFGERTRNIQIEPVTDSAPYADLPVGYIREIEVE